MAIASTTPATTTPGAANTTATNAAAGLNLNSNQFLQLLTTQLQYQDPSNPISNQDFLAQLAQFSTLSGVQSLNSNASNMLLLQQMTQGANLIGHTVNYQAPGATTASQGVVSGINVQNGTLNLVIQGNNVSIDQLQGVTQ
jgi:flagellar basal-body rod modification protein FlgD